MVKFNITTANKLFSDRNFLELQDRRIEQLKILSNLYQESPIKITERIEAIDNMFLHIYIASTFFELNR